LIEARQGALEPLRGKAPYTYIELLVSASGIGNLDSSTVRYIFNELNEIKILDNYGDVVRGYAWSLVNAIIAYAVLLRKYFGHFNSEEVGDMVGRVANLLNELGRFKSSLGVIAWAYALDPALKHGIVKELMEKALSIDVIDKANEVLGRLSKLRGEVQELMSDKEFMSYVESRFLKADEEAVKKVILEASSHLRHALARYRLDNDELDEAEELFNETAEEYREIGDYENYLIARGLALRTEAIKGLVGDELVKKFQQLYEKTFNVEHLMPTAHYLSNASGTLGEYLVSLALTGNYEMIGKLLEEHLWVLNANEQASVLTRLMLNALLRPRGELNGELKGKLSVNPKELINTFGSRMYSEFRPALRVAFGMVRPEDEYEECKSIEDPTKRRDCIGAVLAAADDGDAIWWLRGKLINGFHKQILEKERSGWLRELGFDTNALISEFGKLVGRLDGKSLVQLNAPRSSMAQFVLMLHALINDDEELAKAHALYVAVNVDKKLLTRLFL